MIEKNGTIRPIASLECDGLESVRVNRPATLWEEGCKNDPIRNIFVVPTLVGQIRRHQPRVVVDLGCGTGYITREIASFFEGEAIEWRLLDHSEEMIEFARKSCQGSDVFYINKCDITAEPTSPGSADGDFVFLAYTLLDLVMDKVVATNIVNMLSPSGIVAIFIPDVLEDVIQAATAQTRILEEFLSGHCSVPKLDKFTKSNVLFEANRTETIVNLLTSSGLRLEALDIFNAGEGRNHYFLKFSRRNESLFGND